MEDRARTRVIAFYLPQFHEIPENDESWGKGFTEWTNVRKAQKLFRGHVQPREPGVLGYYNLLDAEAREKQSALAQANGIEAFCYWHYWFGHGRRLLEKPLEEVLRTHEPSIKFCICWANQSWAGIWHGAPDKILQEQNYPGKEDQDNHFAAVLPILRDQRYLTVEGKPLFVIYRPHELPDAKEFVDHWRKLGHEAGFNGLYLVAMSNRFEEPALDHFDAVVSYGPGDFLTTTPPVGTASRLILKGLRTKFGNYVPGAIRNLLGFPRRFDYAKASAIGFERLPRQERFFPCVLSGWDNTPRSGLGGVVFENFSPAKFRVAFRRALDFVRDRKPERRIVFIKAWNEWAEGNYVEPDKNFGSALLDVIREETENQAAIT
jgi:hypothetical protein